VVVRGDEGRRAEPRDLGARSPRSLAVECTPLPVELVVRSYVTGVTSTSIWTHYAEGKRTFCRHALPDGMKKNEPLPAPILTPEHQGRARAATM
jgi:phosphoribosylaminoimidazole-succinocarboxamide synthase